MISQRTSSSGLDAQAVVPSQQARADTARILIGELPAIARSLQSLESSPRAAKFLSAMNDRFGERQGMRSESISLGVRQISTSPTLSVAVISAALFVLLYNASRYQINLAYGIAFLGATSVLAAAWMGFLHLKGLRLSAGPVAEPVMVGEPVRFVIRIEDLIGKRRRHLLVVAGEQEFEVSLDPHGAVELGFLAPSDKPGRLLAPLIKLTTPYPLGIWNIHHLWAPRQECIVWPEPEIGGPPLKGLDECATSSSANQERPKEGSEGFSMLRAYRPGDSPRRVDWRVYAKTDGHSLVTRLSEEPVGGAEDLWIEEMAAVDLAGIPARVARLTAWVLHAHNTGQPYGLRAFGNEIPPSYGDEHLRSCLTALALAPGHSVEVAYGLREWA